MSIDTLFKKIIKKNLNIHNYTAANLAKFQDIPNFFFVLDRIIITSVLKYLWPEQAQIKEEDKEFLFTILATNSTLEPQYCLGSNPL